MRIIAFFLAFFLLGPPLWAQQDINQLAAKETVDRAFAVFKQNEEFVFNTVNFKEKRTEEDFSVSEFRNNPNPRPTSSQTNTSEAKGGLGKMIIAGSEIDLAQTFSSLYQYQIPSNPGDQTRSYNGVECLVIEFEPKRGLRTVKKEDNFTHRLRGQIFINKEDMNIVAIFATIPESFTFTAWRVILPARIRIHSFSLIFSQKYLLGLALKDSATAVVHYDVWGTAEGIKKFTFEYFDYKLRKDKFHP